MNEFQIFKELTELDDDLLPYSSEQGCPLHISRVFTRLPFVAAILVLLAATAYAVGLTISVRYTDQPIERDGFTLIQKPGYGVALEEGSYAAEIDYHLEPVQAKNSEDLAEALTEAWKAWDSGYEFFTGAWLLDENGARRRFHGLAEAGDYLGLPLTLSEALNRADGPCFVRLLIADPAEAALEFADSGRICPAALILEDALALEGSERGVTVFVALRDRLPPSFQLRGQQFLHQEGEPKEQRFQVKNGPELILMQTGAEDEDYNSCVVVWCEQGIGYLAVLRGRWNGRKAEDLLMPLLSELQLP